MDADDYEHDRSTGVARPDLLVAGVTLLLSASTAGFTATKHGEPSFSFAAFMVLTVGAIGLVWRRRFPAAMFAVASTAAAVYGAVDWPDPLIPFAVFVALATVFEHSRATMKWSLLAITALATFVGTAWITDSDALDWWTAVLVVVGAPLIGDYLRAKKRLLEEASARIRRLEAERLHALDDARAAERARVARELHDVVAHHVTMLVVQAEAAASRPDLPAASARSIFDDLARSGRAAMTQLRLMLGVLRSDRSVLATPQPTLRNLDTLLAEVAASGATVSVDIDGPVDTLSTSVDLTAYRIVQEGLTNVVKHAPGSSAKVTITSTDRDLAVVIVNAPAPLTQHSGHRVGDGTGLIGLHERVALLGGTLTTCPGPLGGFRLEAHLPSDTA